MATTDGRVNPSHAATPPSWPARRVPIAIPSWLLAGPGRTCEQRHEVAERRVIQPAPSIHVLAPEVAEVGDRATERGQAEPRAAANTSRTVPRELAASIADPAPIR